MKFKHSYKLAASIIVSFCLTMVTVFSFVACGDGKAPNVAENVGKASVALKSIPSDVMCLQITVVNQNETVVSLFDVQSQAPSIYTMSTLPVGTDQFTAQAFPVACSQVTPGFPPAWMTNSEVSVNVTASIATSVTLELVHNGQANVYVDFPPDDAGTSYLFADSAPSTMYAYVVTVAVRQCAAFGKCCYGADAAAWDESACEATVGPTNTATPHSFAELNSTISYFDGGTLQLDIVEAQKCLDSWDTYSCDSLTPHEVMERNYHCAQSIKGNVPLGGSCTSSFQCDSSVTPAWCNRYYATGYDTCMPIGGIGSPCGIDSSDFACQTHGHGLQQQACDWDVHHATGTQTCQPLLPLGASDGYPSQCQSGLASGGVCVASYPGFFPTTCSYFTKPDAG